MSFKPGFYHSMKMDAYLALPAASASMMIALLERCPRAAWFESWLNPHRELDTSTPAQSVGTLAHALLLEGRTDGMVVVDPSQYPNLKGGGFATDLSSNKAVKEACAAIRASGKIPVLQETADDVEAMAAEARAYLAGIEEPAVRAMFEPDGGESEVTIVWEEDGCLFRMRPDRLSKSCTLQADVKTTKTVAEPDRWGRTQLFGEGYYLTAAFYRRGLKKLTGKDSDYVFLAQEQAKPHLCSLVGMDPAAEDLGDRRIERAIATWKRCMKEGSWPGYPNRIAYPETPGWEMAREEEAHPSGIEQSAAAIGREMAHARDFVDSLPDR